MKTSNYKFLAIFFILVFSSSLLSFRQQIDANDIVSKVDEKLMPPSFEAYRKLINEEPDGSKKEFILYTVKKDDDKVAALFLSPASEKGRATLRLGDNMWLYIPNVGRPIRITSIQSVTGGVFNNSDILRLDFSSEYNAALLDETDSAFILDLKAKTDAVAYDKLKMWVDKKTVMVTKVEAYTASGTLIKVLDFKETKDFGNGIIRPAVIETTSPLQKGYKSVMIFSNIKARALQDEVFTLDFLSRLGEIR